MLMAELSWLIVFRPVPLRLTCGWGVRQGGEDGHGHSDPRQQD